MTTQMLQQRFYKAQFAGLSGHPKVQALESAFTVPQVCRETKLAVQAGLDGREVPQRNV